MSSQDDVVIRLRLADVAKFVADGKAATMTTSEIERGIRKLGVTGKAESHEYGGLGLWGATVGRLKYAVAGLVLSLGAGAVAVAKFGLTAVAQYQQIKIAFTNMLGSSAAADKQIKMLRDFADVTPFEFGGENGIARMAQQLEQAGVAGDRLVGPNGILTAIGDATAAIGGSQADAATSVVDITTMLRRGILTGEVIRDLSHHGISMYDFIEKAFNVTGEQAAKLVEKGKISSKLALDLIIKGVESGPARGMMAVEALSLSGMWSTLHDVTRDLAVDVLKPYLPSMSKAFGDFLSFMQRPETAARVRVFFQTLIDGGKGIYDVLTSRGVVRLLGDLWSAVKWLFDAGLKTSNATGKVLGWLLSPFGGGGKSNASEISDVANAMAALVDNGFSSSILKGLALYALGMKAFGLATDGATASVGRLKKVIAFLSVPKGASWGALVPELMLTGAIVGTVAAVAYHFSASFRKEWNGAWADIFGGNQPWYQRAWHAVKDFGHNLGMRFVYAFRDVADFTKWVGGLLSNFAIFDPKIKFSLTGIAKWFGGGLKAVFTDVWNWVADKMSFDLPGVGHKSFLPHLAAGGTAVQSGWTMTGENGPELQYMPRGASVIPLPRVPEFSGAGSGRPIHTHVYLDRREIAMAVHGGSDDIAARL